MERRDYQEFLTDLSLTVPSAQDYNMIDWMILLLWAYCVLVPSKSPALRLLSISIVELLWGFYDLSIGEYAQSVPFFFYFLCTAVCCLRVPQKNSQ